MMLKRILIFSFIFILLISTNCFAEETNLKIAIMPLVNSAYVDGSTDGEYAGYNYNEILKTSYNNKIQNLILKNNYQLIPSEQINKAIEELGFDTQNIDSLGKNDIISIANITNADIALYIEPLKFSSATTYSNHFYTSFRCIAYNKNSNKSIVFKIDNNINKSGSLFNSQKARSKKNAAIFMDITFDNVFNRLVELGFIKNG